MLNLSRAIRLKYEPLNCHNEEGLHLCGGINSTMYSVLNIAGTGLNAGRVEARFFFFRPPFHPTRHQKSLLILLMAGESRTGTRSQASLFALVQICAFACQPRLSVSRRTFAFNTTPIPFGPKCLSGKVFPIITVYN